MTQKVLLCPNNLECFPTLNVQMCSFIRRFIGSISLALYGKPSANCFLPDNKRGTNKTYTKPKFSLPTDNITETSVLDRLII